MVNVTVNANATVSGRTASWHHAVAGRKSRKAAKDEESRRSPSEGRVNAAPHIAVISNIRIQCQKTATPRHRVPLVPATLATTSDRFFRCSCSVARETSHRRVNHQGEGKSRRSWRKSSTALRGPILGSQTGQTEVGHSQCQCIHGTQVAQSASSRPPPGKGEGPHDSADGAENLTPSMTLLCAAVFSTWTNPLPKLLQTIISGSKEGIERS